jgi:hypothetical protein
LWQNKAIRMHWGYNSRLPNARHIVLQRPALLLLILVFVASLPAVTARFYASDEIEYFAYLRSMWFDRDLSFDNEYRYFYDRGIARAWRFKETFLDGETATGRRINFAPIGSAILWAPIYVVTDAGVRIARALGADVAADGYSKPYIAAVTYGSAFYGFAGLLMSALAALRILDTSDQSGRERAVVVAVLAVWIGTPLLFYMYLAPGFSHACSAFAVAAFVLLWLHVRADWSPVGIAALGAMAALMGMVREQDLFIAIGPAVDYLFTGGRFSVTRALIGIAACAIVFLPQVATYQVLYGRPAPSPTVEGKMTWTSPHAWQVVASPDNGLVFWTPVALVAFGGLAWLAWRSWTGRVCAVMVLTQIYLSGSLDTWAGAGSFGQRRLVGLTVFFVIGVAALLTAIPRGWPRHAVHVFMVLAVWWNLGLTAQFGGGFMDRQRLDLSRNAYNNFVIIPRRVPDLLYRFVFDRESFYQRRTSTTP